MLGTALRFVQRLVPIAEPDFFSVLNPLLAMNSSDVSCRSACSAGR